MVGITRMREVEDDGLITVYPAIASGGAYVRRYRNHGEEIEAVRKEVEAEK